VTRSLIVRLDGSDIGDGRVRGKEKRGPRLDLRASTKSAVARTDPKRTRSATEWKMGYNMPAAVRREVKVRVLTTALVALVFLSSTRS